MKKIKKKLKKNQCKIRKKIKRNKIKKKMKSMKKLMKRKNLERFRILMIFYLNRQL
jgi:hypothetical protein